MNQNKTATAIRGMGLSAIEPPGTQPFGYSFAVGKRCLTPDPFFSWPYYTTWEVCLSSGGPSGKQQALM